MSQNGKKWYLMLDGHKAGPHGFSELTGMIRQSRIDPDTLAWRKGLKAWKPLKDIPDLSKHLTNNSEGDLEDANWYLQLKDKRLGPLTFSELKKQIKAKRASSTNMVYAKPLGKWKKISEVEKLSSLLKGSRPARGMWYIYQKGKKYGPYSEKRMKNIYSEGRLQPESLVWNRSTRKWTPLRRTKLFQQLSRKRNQAVNPKKANEWYYMRGNEKLGPFSTRTIIDSIHSGIIKSDDRIWSNQKGKWINVSDVDEFANAIEDAQRAIENELWYFKKHNQVKGPYTLDQLRQSLKEGDLKLGCPVFSKKLGKWDKISNIQRLKKALAKAAKAGRKKDKRNLWYYRKGKATCGPVKTAFLGEKIKSGEIQQTDPVYNLAKKKWESISEIPELQSFLNATEFPTHLTDL